MKDEIKIEASEFHPEGIVAAVTRSFNLEEVKLETCTATVKSLILTLAAIILMLIKKELNINDDLQEYIDKLNYQSNMDSTNSSCRPSSDLPWEKQERKNRTTRVDEQKNNSPTSMNSSEPCADKEPMDSAEAEPDEFEEAERESEKNLRADHKRSLRKKTGRAAGKQKGAKGYGIKIPEDARWNETVLVPPAQCVNCPNWKECAQENLATEHAAHNVIDVKITVEVTPYKPVSVKCPNKNGKVIESNYPEAATAPNQYGVALQTLLACLYIPGMISFDRIHDIFAPILGLKISPASIMGFVNRLADKIRPAISVMFEYLKTLPVVHLDETSADIDGNLRWIHTISTEFYTFLSLQEKRGKVAMEAIGFLNEYTGCIVHDCLATYWSFENVTHAICNGHILRELEAVSRFFKDADRWAEDMAVLLREMVHAKNKAIEAGLKFLSPEIIQGFSDRFDALIARGKEIHPERKYAHSNRKRKQGKARNLLLRMEQRKDEIFLSIRQFDVPFTNNIAEGSFRMVSKHFRMAGCFRDFEQAKKYIMIWAYLSTAHKQHVSYYEAIRQAFLGNALEVIFPNGVPESVNLSLLDQNVA